VVLEVVTTGSRVVPDFTVLTLPFVSLSHEAIGGDLEPHRGGGGGGGGHTDRERRKRKNEEKNLMRGRRVGTQLCRCVSMNESES
jgi:hypothetical protein